MAARALLCSLSLTFAGIAIAGRDPSFCLATCNGLTSVPCERQNCYQRCYKEGHIIDYCSLVTTHAQGSLSIKSGQRPINASLSCTHTEDMADHEWHCQGAGLRLHVEAAE